MASDVASRYKKLTQLEHVLARPDMYLGSVERAKCELWVPDEDWRSSRRTLEVSPAALKLVDEIVQNAIDASRRHPEEVKTIKVDVNRESGEVVVWNDGRGIPVEEHPEHKCLVPEMVFGSFLSGSNFSDEEKRIVAGRNGIGASAVNAFSKRFVVETADGKNSVKIVWEKNMTSVGRFKTKSSTKQFVRVAFTLDLARLGHDRLDDDLVAAIRRRIHEVAATTPLRVYYDGKRVPCPHWKAFVASHIPDGETVAALHATSTSTDRWRVALVPSPDGQFRQVSFVNGCATTAGGTHVQHALEVALGPAIAAAEKKTGTRISVAAAKAAVWCFVDATVESPAFGSQTKECLTTRASAFGSAFDPPESFAKRVAASAIGEKILAIASKRNETALRRDDGRKTRNVVVEGLEDAIDAGTARSRDTTLIVCEGLSAKAFVLAGLGVVGRKKYGCLPVRGKVLNVLGAQAAKIAANKEISSIRRALGLQVGREYKDASELRYARLVVATDADHDGNHITGLLINVFSTMWPSLLAIDGFLGYFRTPIIKATLGRDSFSFYTIKEFERWFGATRNSNKASIRYLKGLGSSSSSEARTYFQNLPRHLGAFALDGERGETAIRLAFDPKRADQRKAWLASVGEAALTSDEFETELANVVPISEFVDKRLVLFGLADNRRSIPSAIDGMRPSARKVLFTCFSRKVYAETKVAQLGAIVAERTAYAHGEVSLSEVICGLARDYVGSNNVNLLVPVGQFGTRNAGGSDAAASRYIHTHLAPIARLLFPPDDDPLLEILTEDGHPVEPRVYAPVVPLLTINGATGIGSGWSCSWLPRDPRAIVRATRALLAGEEPDLGPPVWRGFKGVVEAAGEKRWVARAPATRDGAVVLVRDLPPGTWTSTYQSNVLDRGVEEGWIKYYSSDSTDTRASFDVTLAGPAVGEDDAAVRKRLKLDETFAETNLVAWSAQGTLTKYNSPYEVLREHFDIRRMLYGRRKARIEVELEAEVERLAQRETFVSAVVDGRLLLLGRSVESLRVDAVALGIADPEPLFTLPIASLTAERLVAIRRDLETRRGDLERARATSADDLWRRDLDALDAELRTWGRGLTDVIAGTKKRATAGTVGSSVSKRIKK